MVEVDDNLVKSSVTITSSTTIVDSTESSRMQLPIAIMIPKLRKEEIQVSRVSQYLRNQRYPKYLHTEHFQHRTISPVDYGIRSMEINGASPGNNLRKHVLSKSISSSIDSTIREEWFRFIPVETLAYSIDEFDALIEEQETEEEEGEWL